MGDWQFNFILHNAYTNLIGLTPELPPGRKSNLGSRLAWVCGGCLNEL